jgi:hypothetical protein
VANDEFSQLPPLRSADLNTINQLIRELNLRLRRMSEKIDQRASSKVKLSAPMDAGFNRLTKVATAVSNDDAMPLGQFEEEWRRIQQKINDELLDPTQATDTDDGTSVVDPIDDDDVAAAIDDRAAINDPPEIAFDSDVGTPSDPIRFALENHTHGGFRTHFLIMGA